MTWFTDSQISAEATVNLPVKARTMNRVQQNITAAFSGDSGAPPLAAVVAGAAVALLALDAVGNHRLITEVINSATLPSNPYTPGTTYSAATLGLASGTWVHLGGGQSGFVELGANDDYYFTNLFMRVV